MLKNSRSMFRRQLLDERQDFFDRLFERLYVVNCEPMCICTPRSRMFFNLLARA